MAGGDKSRKDAHGSSGNKGAAGRRRQAGQLGKPPQNLVFRKDGAAATGPGAGKYVRGRNHQIAECGGGAGCRGNRRERTWGPLVDAVWYDFSEQEIGGPSYP